MGASVRGELSVHKGEVGLAVAAGVREGKLKVFSPVMDNVVGRVIPYLGVKEIKKAPLRQELPAVQDKTQPAVKARAVPHPLLHVLHVKRVPSEYLFVGKELHRHVLFQERAIAGDRLRQGRRQQEPKPGPHVMGIDLETSIAPGPHTP